MEKKVLITATIKEEPISVGTDEYIYQQKILLGITKKGGSSYEDVLNSSISLIRCLETSMMKGAVQKAIDILSGDQEFVVKKLKVPEQE